MRTMLGVLAVLAMTACVPKSHQLLGEGQDGGGTADTGPSSAPWTVCPDAATMGRHMDSCSGWEGAECGGGAHIATCIEGHLLKVSMERGSWGDGSECTDPLIDGAYGVQVVTAGDGCADLWICAGDSAWQRSVCQRDPLPGVRPDAAGSTPWTDCAAALQSGMDGDPCEGDLRCLGSRMLSAGTGSNVLLVLCDAGVLRMMPMMSVIHSDI